MVVFSGHWDMIALVRIVALLVGAVVVVAAAVVVAAVVVHLCLQHPAEV